MCRCHHCCRCCCCFHGRRDAPRPQWGLHPAPEMSSWAPQVLLFAPAPAGTRRTLRWRGHGAHAGDWVANPTAIPCRGHAARAQRTVPHGRSGWQRSRAAARGSCDARAPRQLPQRQLPQQLRLPRCGEHVVCRACARAGGLSRCCCGCRRCWVVALRQGRPDSARVSRCFRWPALVVPVYSHDLCLAHHWRWREAGRTQKYGSFQSCFHLHPGSGRQVDGFKPTGHCKHSSQMPAGHPCWLRGSQHSMRVVRTTAPTSIHARGSVIRCHPKTNATQKIHIAH